ncbi:MAG: TAXI family TRAP transporter solute-binding subunit [Pseudomonadota bacterium]
MNIFSAGILSVACILATASWAQTIENAGFENEWAGWQDIDPKKSDTAISEVARSGSRSAKITGEQGRFEQVIKLSPWSEYELRAYVKGAGYVGLSLLGETFTRRPKESGDSWVAVSLPFSTEAAEQATIFGALADGEARFDDFELVKLRSKSEAVTVANASDGQALEDPVIRILGSDLSSDLSAILHDVAEVTSDETEIRVLAILGDGSINNLNDLLYLRGIDAALVQSDVLLNFRDTSAVRNLENKLAYIAQLGATVGHLLAHEANTTIYALEGKRVYLGEPGSGSFISASNMFGRLGIAVEAVSDLSHPEALAELKAGELDAMFWMEVLPIGLLNLTGPAEGLHLLHIPTQAIDPDAYQIRELTNADYPLIPEGETIQTVASPIALIAYSWPTDHPRHAKMKRFAEIFAAKTETLQSGRYHRSLKDADFYGGVHSGWSFYQ